MGFQGNYQQAGQRGFSVLIEKGDDGRARFLMQSRAVEQGDQDRFHTHLSQTDFPVSVVAQTGMIFCPWCGTNLQQFYGSRVEELDRPGFSVPLN